MTRLGDRLPANFIAAQRRQRIIRAFAEIVVEKGRPGSVAEIVKRTEIARNTFYDTFSGKDDVGRALVSKVFPRLAEDFDSADGLGVLAVEVAARAEMDNAHAAAIDQAAAAVGTLRVVAKSVRTIVATDDSLKCSLPPGRHGLSKDFVLANQRHRLLTALAEAISERGFRRTTVADVTHRAKVSRRTFYEHFDSLALAGCALAIHASSQAAAVLADAGPDSGLGILVVEVAAVGLAEGRSAAIAGVDAVERALLPILPVSRSAEAA